MAMLGTHLSEEHKRKISEARKGKHLTEVTKRKISEAQKGRKGTIGSWGHHWKLSEEDKRKLSEAKKGKKCVWYGKKHTQETKLKISKANKGRCFTEKHKKKLSERRKGRHFSEETRRKLSEAMKGNKNWNWQGGITPIIQRIRHSEKYQQWRQSCFIRDNFTCQKCGDNTGGNLVVHHKKAFNKLMEEAKGYIPLLSWFNACMLYFPLWDISNGITLCLRCHKKLHKKRRKK